MAPLLFDESTAMSLYTACAPTRSLFLQLVRSQPFSRVAIYAALSTTIALVQSLLNSSIICPALVGITAFVDIAFFALPAICVCKIGSARATFLYGILVVT